MACQMGLVPHVQALFHPLWDHQMVSQAPYGLLSLVEAWDTPEA